MQPYLYAETMLDCVCEALHRFTSGGCPERACVYNGSEAVAFDDCCNGQLWVVWERTIPTDWKTQSFGQYPQRSPRTVTSGNCFTLIGMDFEVGILRCAPTFDDHGNPPTCEQLEESARQQHEDAWAILKAVVCCLGELSDLGYYTSWEQQQPIEDEGGCVGSVMGFSVGQELCACLELPEIRPDPNPDPDPEPDPDPGPDCQPTV